MQVTSGFSADTEILTRQGGWVTFGRLTYMDEVATRSPKTRVLEWQYPAHLSASKIAGEMIHFHSRTVDLLVAPSQRVLLTSCPKRIPMQKHGDECLIEAGYLAGRHETWNRLVVTSGSAEPELGTFRVPSTVTAYNEYVTFDGNSFAIARRSAGLRQVDVAAMAGCHKNTVLRAEWGGTVRLHLAKRLRDLLGVQFTEHSTKFAFNEMSGDDYAAFMGMWLAEGSVTWHGSVGKRRRPTIYVTQARKSRGFGPYGGLLARLLGSEPAYNGHSFYFRHGGLAEYLRRFGHAPQKYLPPEILRLPARQAEIFWRYFWYGDGAAERERAFTTSRRMADQFQQLAQAMGAWITVHLQKPPKKPSQMRDGRVIRVEQCKPCYTFALHRYPSVVWTADAVPHEGIVHSVRVPNETVYVRRNGRPVWSGT